MRFSTRNLFSAFSFLFFLVAISPFIERLDVIGKPNLSIMRMGIALLFLFLIIPFYAKNGFVVNKKGIIISSILYAMIGYILLIAAIYRVEFSQITFYAIYIHLVLLGYIAIFPDNLLRLEKLLTVLCLIAITVGFIMMIAGPEKVRAMGIGALEGKWGQFVMTDSQRNSLDDLILFRSFSIFVDHQAFSAFLQLSAFFYRFVYGITKEKKYIWAIIGLLIANTLSFSSTGYFVILVILLSVIRLRYIAIITPLLFSMASYLYAIAPDITLLMFHQGSFGYRIKFMERALAMIHWMPSLDKIVNVDFSADCYVLWMTYKYGIVYAILQFLLLFAFIVLLADNQLKIKAVIALVFLFLINILSNGACFSTPNNILLPVLFGMVASYSLRYNNKRTSQ